MTRLMATGVALFVLFVGAAAPAAAQPIPPEGPAINPSIYKVPAGAKTVAVDCDDTKQTLAAAVADRTAGDLNVVFSGTCREYVYLNRDNVAIRGKDSTATIIGGIEITGSRRVLLEGFTCRDTTQQEYCIGAIAGSSVTLHNMKVANASIRGVLYLHSVGIIDGLTVEKTGSTSILVRGSNVQMEGELTFLNTIEGCVVIDNVSSVFSKGGALTARNCAVGIVVQSNSNFYAPFANFTLNANSFAGLMLLTQGTFSYGGTVTAKNNTRAGILIEDGSSFSPFTNISSGAALTLENNGRAGVMVRGGSFAELANVAANTGSTYGVLVEDARLQVARAKIVANTTADIRLQFGARATLLEGAEYGSLSCDGTELLRGAKAPCTKEAAKPKPTASKSSGQPDEQ